MDFTDLVILLINLNNAKDFVLPESIVLLILEWLGLTIIETRTTLNLPSSGRNRQVFNITFDPNGPMRPCCISVSLHPNKILSKFQISINKSDWREDYFSTNPGMYSRLYVDSDSPFSEHFDRDSNLIQGITRDYNSSLKSGVKKKRIYFQLWTVPLWERGEVKLSWEINSPFYSYLESLKVRKLNKFVLCTEKNT